MYEHIHTRTHSIVEHIGHVGKMSVSGYGDGRFNPLLHQYIVSLSETLNPQYFCRLSCEMSTRQEHPREGCLVSAMSSSEEVVIINNHCRKVKINTYDYKSLQHNQTTLR